MTVAYHGPKTVKRRSRRPNLAELAISERVVEIVPVRVVEMVPVRLGEAVPTVVVEIVPVLVVEIVPALVVEIVPPLARVVADTATTNIPAQTMHFTFFIFLLLVIEDQGYVVGSEDSPPSTSLGRPLTNN